MNINKIRSFLYKTSKYLGDVNAVQKGTIGKRIMRRAAGKASGKLMNKDIQIKKPPKRAFSNGIYHNRYLMCDPLLPHHDFVLVQNNRL
ncbi:MAG: hypothetical protein ACQEWO_01705 [Bacillota bacterium]